MYHSILKIFIFLLLLFIEVLILFCSGIYIFKINITDISNLNYLSNNIKIFYISGVYGSILLNIYIVQKFYKKGISDLGIKLENNYIKYFLYGIIISTSLLIFQNILQLILKLSSFQIIYSKNITFIILFNILVSFLFGFIEELLFRGFILQNLFEDFSKNVSIIVSSYIYAQLHFLRFDLSLKEIILPIIGLFLVGLVLSYAYLLTNSLWMSIGMHTGWIYLITITNQLQLLKFDQTKIIITGGYNPVSGLLGIFLLALTLLVLKKQIK